MSSSIEALQQRLEQVEAERDALAASYEALANEVRGIIQDSDGVAGYHLNGDVADWDEFELGDLLSEQGPDCLACRDARVKAKALDDAADAIDRVGTDYPQGFLRGRAAKLRQQAEGGGDE
ncbi:hypothetical protein C6W88_15795 [Halomonas litopenaei]|uniref:DksA C4-type domain-containing protein n=1 Tax=Halomonas litopenaei TaxID=2109328 RepID=A0ABX5IUQ9_9GAMM|nr:MULTISPECIES: hypothetical protein [Halomonas]PTL88580.1 hypothetical protein C6W89_20940 [Halomonas sp. SYSU XM8]PTL93473.1 hypothetical protein C6W88_15795 [Halomonas litopenaei]